MSALILPWVKVSGLAAYLLSQVAGRVSQDWQVKYGHPIYLLESFVEPGRFAGTCYRAANWLWVGRTQGRGRQGPNRLAPSEAIKDVFLYPLIGRLRQRLLEVAHGLGTGSGPTGPSLRAGTAWPASFSPGPMGQASLAQFRSATAQAGAMVCS